jgi:hypothetical protein
MAKKEKLIHCDRRKIAFFSFQQDNGVYASKHLKI